MIRILNRDFKLYFENFYPYKKKRVSNKKYSVLLSIGGNIGNVKWRFKKLFNKINSSKRVNIIKTSPILKNPPFGFIEQDDFFNALILVKTDMYVESFFRYVEYLENYFKRERSFANAPRTLDIDIVFFDKIAYRKNGLTIPHLKWQERSSVLIPLIFLKD
jgi:2-amino-4-hydroxy-6-hydroxymethyldihydropteridine diphosphokinase